MLYDMHKTIKRNNKQKMDVLHLSNGAGIIFTSYTGKKLRGVIQERVRAKRLPKDSWRFAGHRSMATVSYIVKCKNNSYWVSMNEINSVDNEVQNNLKNGNDLKKEVANNRCTSILFPIRSPLPEVFKGDYSRLLAYLPKAKAS